jgi:arabinoxylan arabinofuranohydrolase
MTKAQAFNPFLPSFEYVPDPEPHVFGERVYLYGSHDRFDGTAYCQNDYVCWSAPVDDLSDWRFEGVIFKKTQDSMNKDGKHKLFAPDVARGPDGRYYLYYALDFVSVMAVAVCDAPAGEYQFYGYVERPDGSLLWERPGDPFLFDPGVLVDDDGRVYVYSGFAPKSSLLFRLMSGKKRTFEGGYVIELEPDMKTVRGEPRLIFQKVGQAVSTGFEGHEFFEASSIRKIGDTYYFIYSSINGHELCYATSKSPTGGFAYGGTIISNGDLYLNGRSADKQASNYIGNNHGSLVEIDGQWYVFHHRHTNRSQFSRQTMAEPVTVRADGSIPQVELTSCGLNAGPLRGTGEYEARIACHLMSARGAGRYGFGLQNRKFRTHPYFTQEGEDREERPDQYIANFRDGAVAGFKYFDIRDLGEIAVTVRGSATGWMNVSTAPHGDPVARIAIQPSRDFATFSAPAQMADGQQALYFTLAGKGRLDFRSFGLKVSNTDTLTR